MSTLTISRMVVPLMAVGVAVVATLVFANRYVGPQPSDDHATAVAVPAASQPVAAAQDQAPAGLAAVQAETNRLVATLEPSPTPADAPEFDVASIQPTGEAVIAGRAAPGATVELLRNGELHDRTVADQAGLFVMIPRPLPPGTYDLTLHSRQTDGKEATSKQRVAVALESPASQQPAIAQSKPSEPSVRPASPAAPAPVPPAMAVETGKTEPSAAAPRVVAAVQPKPSGSTGTLAPRPPRLAAVGATVLPGLVPPSTASAPKMTTATVTRGDSLWRISQRALGAGTRYSVLYRANRDRIHNADLIYPGQVFILPAR
jgi:nucleoid-associated protein YgaU